MHRSSIVLVKLLFELMVSWFGEYEFQFAPIIWNSNIWRRPRGDIMTCTLQITTLSLHSSMTANQMRAWIRAYSQNARITYIINRLNGFSILSLYFFMHRQMDFIYDLFLHFYSCWAWVLGVNEVHANKTTIENECMTRGVACRCCE